MHVPEWKQMCVVAIATAVVAFATLSVSGCKSAATSTPASQSQTQQPQTPARPTVAAPPFKVFHQDEGKFTLVTKVEASDDEIASLIWQLRDAAQAHKLDTLKISQKVVDAHGPTAWFHIYRGSRCAAEKYADGAPPCGASYHAAGDYTFGSSANPHWDQGTLVHGEGRPTYLWDPEAPYVVPKR